MKTITIDGRVLEVPDGTMIWDAAREAGVKIPALCRHEGLPHDGACRVCVVELVRRGWSKLVASCMFPIQEDGLTVHTNSDMALKGRSFVIEMLLRRNGRSPAVQALAKEWGVTKLERLTPFMAGELCVRCGRCVRACAIDGNNALCFASRGWERHVATPYEEPAQACVGCLACAAVCPTGHITYKEQDGVRTIWGRDFHMTACARCGEFFGSPEQLEFMKLDTDTCPRCRVALTAERFTLEEIKKEHKPE